MPEIACMLLPTPLCLLGECQYFVIVSCSKVLRDNDCMYVAHVCFYVCCSDSAGVCGEDHGISGVVIKGCGFH